MKILLDLNVVLDLLLDPAPWVDAAKEITGRVLTGAIQGSVCATSIPTLHYVARRIAGQERATLAVQRCPATFDVIPVTGEMLHQACALAGVDFEDNVQIVAASSAAVDAIVTRDAAGFHASHLPVLSPAEFLSKYS